MLTITMDQMGSSEASQDKTPLTVRFLNMGSCNVYMHLQQIFLENQHSKVNMEGTNLTHEFHIIPSNMIQANQTTLLTGQYDTIHGSN